MKKRLKKVLLSGTILLLALSCRPSIQHNYHIVQLPYPDSLHVILRADWGWQPLPKDTIEQPINKITIHHGGIFFSPDSDAAAYVRHLQWWSRTKKHWIDIPYHFMIDFQGNIYEARPINYPGDTNTAYNPYGHALICLIGNFEEQKVTPAQLTSLVRLSAFLTDYFHVPLQDIRGHRDYTETLCPGADLYHYLQNGYITSHVKMLTEKKSSLTGDSGF